MAIWISYWRERFRPLLFIPVAAALAVAAHAGVVANPTDRALDAIRALLLLAQFRLWDDLADRERDRPLHPTRVLVGASRMSPFVATCVVLATVNLALQSWLRGPLAAAMLATLDLAAAAWYSWRPSRRTAAADLVLLTKYPAFVLVLAIGSTTPAPHITLSAAAIYALACLFEAGHDASGPLRVTNS